MLHLLSGRRPPNARVIKTKRTSLRQRGYDGRWDRASREYRRRQALRAVADNPGGLRHEAYPAVMPVLQELGYVEERATRGRTGRRAWHLTRAGRELLIVLGIPQSAE